MNLPVNIDPVPICRDPLPTSGDEKERMRQRERSRRKKDKVSKLRKTPCQE